MKTPEFSVIIPVYNSMSYLNRATNEIVEFFQSERKTYEIILVNDASTDRSWELMKKIKSTNLNSVITINVKKNVGQYAATIIGLYYARGIYMITIDADFYPVGINLKNMTEDIKPTTAIIYGKYESTHADLFRKMGSRLFNFIIRRGLNKKLRHTGSSFRLISDQLLHKVLPVIHHPLLLDVQLIRQAVNVEFLPAQTDTVNKRSSYSFVRLIQAGLSLINALALEKIHMQKGFNPMALVDKFD